MGIVVESVIRRTRSEIGVFRRREWREFLHAIGLRYTFAHLPDACDAVLYNGRVVFRNGLSEDEIIHAAYHEGGHHLTVAGDVRFWLSRPQGYITVARFERQANEFAALFPIWESE